MARRIGRLQVLGVANGRPERNSATRCLPKARLLHVCNVFPMVESPLLFDRSRGIFNVDTLEEVECCSPGYRSGETASPSVFRVLAEQLEIRHDSEVDLLLDQDHLIIKPRRPKPSLSALLARVTEENIHSEVTTGEPIGARCGRWACIERGDLIRLTFNPKPVMSDKAVVPQLLCLQLPAMVAWSSSRMSDHHDC